MDTVPRVVLLLTISLVLFSGLANAGPNRPAPVRPDYLAETVEFYKAGLERMLPIYEADLQRTTALRDQALDMYSRRELPFTDVERANRLVTGARERIAETRRDIQKADVLVVESRARWHLIELGRAVPGAYQVGRTVIRYLGTGPWSLAELGTVERFFQSRFGAALPVSALGQTNVHDRLGFDHRGAVDVKVHPDTREGIALMDWLRARKIPFIAYRGAVAGAATGAHVHIGLPSERLESRR